MENKCSIIGDLMPLCAEGLASEDSVKLVEQHITGCESCRTAYEELKSSAGKTPELSGENGLPLKRVKKELRKRRARIAVLCALGIFAIMMSVFSNLMTRQYLPYSPELITVEEAEGGKLNVSISRATGFDTTYSRQSDEPEEGSEPDRLEIELWTTKWDELTSRRDDDTVLYFELDGIKAIDYVDCANDGELIRVYGEPMDGGCIVLERLVLNYYFILATLAAIFTGILWLIFRKRRAGKTLSYIFFAPVSYIIAHLATTGANAATYAAADKFVFIIITAAAIYLMTVIARRIIAQK